MIVKHAIHSWRNRVVTLVQLLLPVIFAIVACFSKVYFTKETDPPPLPLNLSYFGESVVPFAYRGAGSVAPSLANTYSKVASKYGQTVDTRSSSPMIDYLIQLGEGSLTKRNRHYIVAAEATGNVQNGWEFTYFEGYFNNYALHSIAISLSLVDNTLLQYALPGSPRIVTVNHPLPRTVDTRTKSATDDSYMSAFTFCLLVSFGMSFLVGSFVIFVVKQRANKAKHSQFVSGVDAAAFWLAAFCWDLLSFAVPSVLIIVVVLAFQTESYSAWPVFG